MDRDIALQIVTKLGNLNTALQALSTNTTPVTPSASLTMSRLGSAVDPEEELEAPAEEPEAPEEPETRTKK